MKAILINSNPESSFVASIFGERKHVKYASELIHNDDKVNRSPDKLAQCLKLVVDEVNSDENNLSEIDAISVITGPGSFTGIRVGLSLAKGIADFHNKKIIPIDNFELIREQAYDLLNTGNYCILVPAKPPEFYYSNFNDSIETGKGCEKFDEIVSKFGENGQFVGNFSDEYEKKLGYFRFVNIGGENNELDAMERLTLKKLEAGKLFNSDEIEPLYLKDFTFRKTNN